LSGQHFHDCLPAFLEASDAFLQLCILLLSSLLSIVLDLPLLIGTVEFSAGHARSQLSVLLLELGHTALEGGELRLALVTGVLCCDAVAVGAGLFALLSGHFCAGALSRRSGKTLGDVVRRVHGAV
jgi:hypothetical protein